MAAAPLKHILGAALVRELAGELRAVYRAFDVEGFVMRCTRGLDGLELSARAALLFGDVSAVHAIPKRDAPTENERTLE